MGTPTKQQITAASRMQELGIGQDSEKGILDSDNIGHEIVTADIYEMWPSSQVGYLPNAAECWVEILELCKDDASCSPDICYTHKGWLLTRGITKYIMDDEDYYLDPLIPVTDLDEAFRQALITLAAQ